MLITHNVINNIEEASGYHNILTSILLEELILKRTKNTFLEELMPRDAIDEKQLRGLLGACSSTTDFSEQKINNHIYFIQQAITIENASLAKDDELSDQLIDFLEIAQNYSLPLSQEKPGYVLGQEIENNGFFLAQKKSDFLSQDGYLGLIISNVNEKRSGFKGDLSIVSSQYLGDGKFFGNSLFGIRLSTKDALKCENEEHNDLRNKLYCALVNQNDLFDYMKHYVSSKKNNGDIKTIKVLSTKRITYR